MFDAECAQRTAGDDGFIGDAGSRQRLAHSIRGNREHLAELGARDFQHRAHVPRRRATRAQQRDQQARLVDVVARHGRERACRALLRSGIPLGRDFAPHEVEDTYIVVAEAARLLCDRRCQWTIGIRGQVLGIRAQRRGVARHDDGSQLRCTRRQAGAVLRKCVAERARRRSIRSEPRTECRDAVVEVAWYAAIGRDRVTNVAHRPHCIGRGGLERDCSRCGERTRRLLLQSQVVTCGAFGRPGLEQQSCRLHRFERAVECLERKGIPIHTRIDEVECVPQCDRELAARAGRGWHSAGPGVPRDCDAVFRDERTGVPARHECREHARARSIACRRAGRCERGREHSGDEDESRTSTHLSPPGDVARRQSRATR